MQNSIRCCPGCGAALDRGGIDGFCGRCLAGAAFGLGSEQDESPESAPRTIPARIGDYELLGELGRGGMGVVYRARQVGLGRDVALKVQSRGPFSRGGERDRFRGEAMAAASLQHPNIVAVHEVGEADGHAYFSMDLVEGLTLAELVREGPMEAERAARYMAKVADAVAFAHARGILHRDLKPANVLIDAQDQPRVTDFGLAKRLGDGGRGIPGVEGWTVAGAVFGSPGYMPPEQADPSRGDVGVVSDVYALGAMLYHLVTGRAPFAAPTVSETLAQVLHEDAVPPRRLNSSLPRALETICLKCLEKAPERRYPSAAALSQDLEFFLTRRPIQAKPVSRLERMWLMCRRKPLLAGLSLALAAVGAAGLGGVFWQARANRLNLYAADLRLASEALNQGDLGRARELLGIHGKIDVPGVASGDFGWRLLRARSAGDGARVVGQHPWIVSAVAWSPDGRWLASGSVGSGTVSSDVRIWDVAAIPREPVILSTVGARELSWFPDSRRLLSVEQGGSVRIWDVTARSVLRTIPGRSGTVTEDGKWLVVCEGNPFAWDAYLGGLGPVRVLDLELGGERNFPEARMATLSGDGRWVATSDLTNQVRIYDRESGQLRRELASEGDVWGLTFSPDGTILVATGFQDDVRVWRWGDADGTMRRLKGHQQSTWRSVFSHDGRRLITTASDQTLRAWDTRSWEATGLWRGHGSEVWAVGMSPDGQRMASGGKDRTVMIWDTTPPVIPATLEARNFAPAILSCDGRRLVSISQEDPAITLIQKLEEPTRTHSDSVEKLRGLHPVAFLEGTYDLVVANGFRVGLHRGGTNVEGEVDSEHDVEELPPVHWTAVGPRTERLAGAAGSVVSVWERASGRRTARFRVPGLEPWDIAASRNGRWIGVVGGEKGIWLVDVTGGTGRWITAHRDMAKAVAFSKDSRWMATASVDATIKLWSLPGVEEKATLRGHMQEVTALAFAPDGVTLGSCELGRGLRLWHLPTLREVVNLPMPDVGEWLAFSDDGRRLGVRLAGGGVRLLSAP